MWTYLFTQTLESTLFRARESKMESTIFRLKWEIPSYSMGTDIIKLKQPGPYQTTTYFTIPVCSSCLDYLPPGVPPSLTQREPNVKQDPRLKSTNLHQISTPRIYLWQYLAPFFLVMTIPRHTMSRHNLPPLSPQATPFPPM